MSIRRLAPVSLVVLCVAAFLSGSNSFASQTVSTATAVAAGYGHTCALTSAGAVKCWGWNTAGQLGDGTTTDSLTPVAVSGLSSGVAAIAAGSEHTCALTSAGAVKCWGGNGAGELGDGTTTTRSTPVAVSGLSSGVVAIAVGGHHTCALTSAGAVKCWGMNSKGQLGDGTTTNRSTPVQVYGLSSGVTAIAAGDRHTCALTSAGAVKCWGANAYGQLGNGKTNAYETTTPQAVVGLASGVSAIAAGSEHTCARMSTGALKCWGANYDGQLGDGTTTTRLTPVGVEGLSSGVAAIALGNQNHHTCAVTSVGAAECWGSNDSGQIGDGTGGNVDDKSLIPVGVSGLSSGVTAIAAGGTHTCAVRSTGGLECWGGNRWGQLGNGTGGNVGDKSLVAVEVVGFESPRSLAVTLAGAGTGSVSSSPSGIACPSTCSHDFAYGTSVALTATPATGSSFAGWSGDCAGTGTCVITTDAARSVTATFLRVPRTLTIGKAGDGEGTVVSTPAGVQCGSTCSRAFENGTSVTLTATAAAGSTFAGWSGACSGTGGCTVTMDANKTVTASFEAAKTLTVARTGSGSGTVSSTPAGIDCGDVCSYAYASGTAVTLSATAGRGYRFLGWSGDCSGTGECTVSMDTNHSVGADFGWVCVVPKVTGKKLAAAKRAIRKAHCAVGKVRKAHSAKVKRGRVISQKPRPGKHLRAGAKVSLRVSRGR